MDVFLFFGGSQCLIPFHSITMWTFMTLNSLTPIFLTLVIQHLLHQVLINGGISDFFLSSLLLWSTPNIFIDWVVLIKRYYFTSPSVGSFWYSSSQCKVLQWQNWRAVRIPKLDTFSNIANKSKFIVCIYVPL